MSAFAGMVGNRNRQRANPKTDKKLTFKSFKRAPKLTDDFVENSWTKLHAAIKAIHEKKAVPQSLEELFKIVENLSARGQADLLYGRVKQMCDDHIHAELLNLSDTASADSVSFLSQILALWKDHFNQMLLIRSVFLYLDRLFKAAGHKLQSLFDLGLTLFRQHLDAYPEIARKTIAGILRQIEAERQGAAIDRNQVYELLRMLTSLNLYEDKFQPLFLEESKKFYGDEGVRMWQTSYVPSYLEHCSRRLAEEIERSENYLAVSSKKPLIKCLEEQLVDRHLAAVLEQGFADLVKEHRVSDLARLRTLSERVNRSLDVKKAFSMNIRKVGEALVMDPEKDPQMIESLLSMKAKLDQIVADAFKGEIAFENALKDSFEAFINKRSNKPAELVAKYVDAELKSGSKGKTEDELESNLENALMLFRYLSGKDVFEAFYKKDLAKRLLLGRSASSDAEKVMITKLKAECGSQFTSKLEGMFKDMDLSREFMMSFKQSGPAQRGLPPGLDLSVNVLTTGNWPSEALIPATLPQELAQCSQVFSEFYLSKHSGRRLVWHNTLGTCILKAQFKRGAKELVVSLFQSIVLMLFNEAESLTYKDIKEQSGIDSEKELERTLQSLSLGKVRVLLKEPKTKEVKETDVFTFNAGFSASLYRVRINTIQLKETSEENTKTNEQVIQDRQYQIDAAIVRTMKMRKTLSHKLLMNELMQMLKFPIGTPDLKKRVESLIEREFLERDPSNSSIYNYLA